MIKASLLLTIVMLAPSALAQSIPVSSSTTDTASTTQRASGVAQWEYARFTYDLGGGYSWVTDTERVGDGNFKKFVTRLGFPALVDHPSAEMAILGAQGQRGWELVSCHTARISGLLSENDRTTCFLKRLRIPDVAPSVSSPD